MKRLNVSSAIYAVCVACFFPLLVYSYRLVLDAGIYSVALRLEQFSVRDEFWMLAFGYLISIIPFLWISPGRSVIKCVYVTIYVTLFVPSLFFILINKAIDQDLRIVFALALLANALVLYVPEMIKPVGLNIGTLLTKCGRLVLLALLLAILVVLLPRLTDLAQLIDVRALYQRRLELRSGYFSGESSRIIVYFANWAGMAFAPFFVALAIGRRSVPLLVLGVLIALVAFAASTNRINLFPSALVALIGMATVGWNRQEARRHVGIAHHKVVTIIVTALVAFPVVLRVFGFPLDLNWYLTFRLFHNSGFLFSKYVEFFLQNEKIYYSESLLRFFRPESAELSVPMRIGRFVTNYESVNNANAGFLADGFANAGKMGMFAATVQLALVLWFVRAVAVNREKAVASLAILPLGIVVANVPVQTALVNSGILVSMLLIFFILPRRDGRLTPTP